MDDGAVLLDGLGADVVRADQRRHEEVREDGGPGQGEEEASRSCVGGIRGIGGGSRTGEGIIGGRGELVLLLLLLLLLLRWSAGLAGCGLAGGLRTGLGPHGSRGGGGGSGTGTASPLAEIE